MKYNNDKRKARKYSLPNFNLYAHIKECIRQRFYKWPFYQEALRKARVEIKRYKKDGTEYLVPNVFYKCAKCNQFFKRNKVEVDHIQPVAPLKNATNSIQDLVNRQFTDKLQVLCKECHKNKSRLENKLRREGK